jgi:membrane protein implicated in regulation of membrane protease activity
MTIGAALVLIAVGAILRFAIATVSTHGVDLHTIGDILMIVGAVGVVLWMFVWAPWVRRRSNPPPPPPYDGDRPPANAYRGDRAYRAGETEPLEPSERRYRDPYA